MTEVANLALYTSLTRASLVAGHMASSAVETSMIHFSPFGDFFLLAASSVRVVVGSV